MTKKQTLTVKKRDILGKKVKRLRKSGVLPANIFGKKVASTAVQVDLLDFKKLLAQVGETEVVNVKVEGEKELRPVLIHDVQKEPVLGGLVHVDFLQVDLTEKVKVGIPIKFMGEAPAIKESKGVLLELMNELEVEALPADLPQEIKVDTAGLHEINDTITVGSIDLPKDVQALEPSDKLVCKVESQQVDKEKDEAEEEVVAPEATKEPEGTEKEVKKQTPGESAGA